jgi:hypothetical protein
VAPTIELIGSGCASNLMRILIRLTAPLSGLFYAISFQIVGILIAFMASSVNYAFLLFADTAGHEFALSVPILATALFYNCLG